MAFFRSEKMQLCTMLLHKESAFDCIAELGYMGVVQFNDLAEEEYVASFAFSNEVKRCSELQTILQHMETEFEEAGIKITFYPDVDEEMPLAKDLKEIEVIVLQVDQELTNVEKNYEALLTRKRMLREKYYVMLKANDMLQGGRNTESVMAWSDSVISTLIRDEVKLGEGTRQGPDNLKLGFFSGSIPAERFYNFEKVLWRLCRGNYYMRSSEIEVMLEDAHHTSGKVRKYAFIVFFQGDALRQKISKMCQGFGIRLYECPESRAQRKEMIKKIHTEVEDMGEVIAHTDKYRRQVLQLAAADFFIWKVKISRCLMIYFTLNKLSAVKGLDNQNYFQAECWIPTPDVPLVRQALMKAVQRTSSGDGAMFSPIVDEKLDYPWKTKPTYFRLNKFTRGFQNLIDSYGVAVYQELNPAPYTIITFPFLFAVMFGDIGHGIILALFGLWMAVKEKKLEEKFRQSEILNILFAGRYIILLMGIFSVYTGFIYNDCFSLGINLFGSSWRVNYLESTVETNKHLQLDPALAEFYSGVPYIFGIDPVWHASGENAIVTQNSLKMKLAIILGIVQMMFGLALSAFNHLYNKNYIDLFLVCAPQIIFLFCLFVYLAMLIFLKWASYGGHLSTPYNSACAPSILITFIDMVLMKGQADAPPGCEKLMYEGQPSLQSALLLVAMLCIPVLLAGKPLLFMYQQRQIRHIADSSRRNQLHRDTRESVRRSLVYNVDSTASKDEDKGDIGELWIHQGIHCIESVLGSVSHTASYLRLWALSLAHNQLSSVLWKMVLAPFLKGHGVFNAVLLYLAFWAWSSLTLAILVVMEGLSAFLHTLRLHWVEFQSKFYTGSGELFIPFRFEKYRFVQK